MTDSVVWKQPNDEQLAMDRDSRAVRFAAAKGAGRERMTPRTPGGHRDAAWGGALCRVMSDTILPTREDAQHYLNVPGRYVPGRYVPIGYARYVSPTVNPYDYKYYRVSGWRIAFPRTTPTDTVKYLLNRIFHDGPQSAGYVRIGDALVPGSLGPGDRVTVAESAVGESPR